MPVILYGILAIAIGILFLFFGIRLFRTVLATTGFILGALLAFIIVANIREQYNWGPNGDICTFIVCCAFGILGAVLSLSVWMLALVGVGALAGFGLSIYILSWKPELASSAIHRPIFIACLTIFGGCLAIAYERAIVMIATSIVGAISLSSGVDVFALTGFNEVVQEIVKNKAYANFSSNMYALLGSCAAIAFIGFLVQVFVTCPDPKKHQR